MAKSLAGFVLLDIRNIVITLLGWLISNPMRMPRCTRLTAIVPHIEKDNIFIIVYRYVVRYVPKHMQMGRTHTKTDLVGAFFVELFLKIPHVLENNSSA